MIHNWRLLFSGGYLVLVVEEARSCLFIFNKLDDLFVGRAVLGELYQSSDDLPQLRAHKRRSVNQ